MSDNSLAMNSTNLYEIFSKHWWVLLLRGVAALIFGILSYWQPGLSMASLVLFFGAYCLADGLLGVWTAFEARNKHKAWWPLILSSVLNIGIGVMTFISPSVAALALVMIIAFWAIATGTAQIMTAIHLRKEIENEWMLGLAGLVSILFGMLILAQPGVGALAVIWMIAAYAMATGILLILLAFKCKKLPFSKLSA